MNLKTGKDLTQARLMELFEYDPGTGFFSYRTDGRNFRRGNQAGTSDGQGYLKQKVDGRKYRLHRLAWLYVHGEWPENDIDHINGDRSDNRIANLRDVPRAHNLQNARRRQVGAAGLAGVTPKGRRFGAQIYVDGKNIALGRYDTAQEAHEAYLSAKRELHPGYVA